MKMEYMLIAIGGSLGSLSRFLVSKSIAEKHSGAYPLGTFTINLAGAFFAGDDYSFSGELFHICLYRHRIFRIIHNIFHLYV